MSSTDIVDDLLTRRAHFIDGQWVAPAEGRFIQVVSPHTERCIGSAPDASATDMEMAVHAARRAFG
jgi:betaine-aldehyde dehydrogenase